MNTFCLFSPYFLGFVKSVCKNKKTVNNIIEIVTALPEFRATFTQDKNY